MKAIYLLSVFSLASTIIMVVVDLLLGARNEFLNAYSVLQRMFGQTPFAGDSPVAQKIGAMGEAAAVFVDSAIGAALTAIVL